MKYLLSFLKFLFNERGSAQVTTAMIDMFSANVMHLSQQSESRLFPYCRQESQNAESAFYDRIGLREAKDKEGRHSKVTYSNTPHSRRMVTMLDKYDADLVDNEDKLRTIMNLDNEYAVAIAQSLARELDKIIIDAAVGSAYGGKKGTDVIALPDAQKIVAFDGTAVTGTGLNVDTLRAVKKKFHQNEAVKKGEMIIFAYAAQQMDDLLGNTEVTSADYNSVKALVQGEVDTFMGFKFVQLELLNFTEAAITYNKDNGAVNSVNNGTLALGEGRVCFAFTNKRALLASTGKMVEGKITEMAEYHYAKQVYGSLTMGSTRMEEVQVVAVYCKEV